MISSFQPGARQVPPRSALFATSEPTSHCDISHQMRRMGPSVGTSRERLCRRPHGPSTAVWVQIDHRVAATIAAAMHAPIGVDGPFSVAAPHFRPAVCSPVAFVDSE